MNPILFEAGTTAFNTNGLGRLSDAITCEVTEERNGSYELEMTYPVDGIHYDDIRYSRIIYAMPADSKDPQPFQIYEIDRPINGQITVRAEHISYRMSSIPVEPFTARSVNGALSGLKSHAVESCPFNFTTDKNTTADFKVEIPTSMRSLLGGSSGSILDTYGGEFEFDGFNVHLYNNRGSDRGVTIRYGKNLTDLKQEESIANTYTGIMPYWKGNVQAEGATQSTEEIVTLDEKVVYSDKAGNFPYHRTVVVDLSSYFKDSEGKTAPTQAELKAAAERYIKNNKIGVPKVSITLKFIPLWQTEEYKDMIGIEHVNLCDTVHVDFEKLGVSTTAKVTKTVFDVLTERYTSIDVGEMRSTLSTTINESINDLANDMANNYSTKTLMEQAIDNASALITGGLGGYVIIKRNADGQPEELLVLGDNPDYTKAQKVWRWNKNGLGYSTTGYDGRYTTAITSDGKLVVDQTTTNKLVATSIISGIIQDVKGNNYWDLDTGELRIAPTIKVGTSVENQTLSDFADQAGKEAVNDQTQLSIFNKLTNNGETQGIYLYNGRLYLNASYIQAGSLESNYITMYGAFNCYSYNGGWNYAGYMGGIQSANDSSYGMAMARGSSIIIVTDNGARMTSEGTSLSVISGKAAVTGGNITADGDIWADGELKCGGTKSRTVETDDYGIRKLYCYEMASPVFGDIGEGTIGEDGLAYIQIDPTFSETVSTSQYQVFLQRYGEGNCYVKERKPTYFIVAGDAGLSFGWEIKAKQSDFDQVRLESDTKETAERNFTNYATSAVEHINRINEGRATV